MLQLPTPSSLAYRERLASLISPLKRVRPRVFFFELGAHRIPTLWTLYRGLLKNSPTDHVSFRITRMFNVYRLCNSPRRTKELLERGYNWLDIFIKAREGDQHWRAVLERYSSLIAAKRDKEAFKRTLLREAVWQDRLRNRPIMLGCAMRPRYEHGPLPRLRPQPIHITGMINSRKKARFKRIAKQRQLLGFLQDMRLEVAFENALKQEAMRMGQEFEPVYGDCKMEWYRYIVFRLRDYQKSFELDTARASAKFPRKLLLELRAARKERGVNTQREVRREKRGEDTFRRRKRRYLGYPTQVMERWSPKKMREMHVVRQSVSEVGYVGMLKRKMGWKIKPPEDQYGEEDLARLEHMEAEIQRENLKRRAESNVEAGWPREESSLKHSQV